MPDLAKPPSAASQKSPLRRPPLEKLSGRVTPPPPGDSLRRIREAAQDSLRADSLERARPRPWIGISLGAGFYHLREGARFTAGLDSLIGIRWREDSAFATSGNLSRDSTHHLSAKRSRVLQPYPPVLLAIPVSLLASLPLFPGLDLLLEGSFFWKQQQAILEHTPPSGPIDPATPQNLQISYTLQCLLAGAGFRLQLPLDFISMQKDKPLHLTCLLLWNPGVSELYTPFGSRRLDRSLTPQGFQIFTGYEVGRWREISLAGSLGFRKLFLSAPGTWGDLLTAGGRDPLKITVSEVGMRMEFRWLPRRALTSATPVHAPAAPSVSPPPAPVPGSPPNPGP